MESCYAGEILSFKLLVNNRDVVRSLDFFFSLFFWSALVNLLYGSQGTNSQQCDCLCYLFVPKCVHMKYGGAACFSKRASPLHYCIGIFIFLQYTVTFVRTRLAERVNVILGCDQKLL